MSALPMTLNTTAETETAKIARGLRERDMELLADLVERDGFLFHRDNNPACFNTRQTLAGLTATTSASSIMNVSRR